MNDSTVTVVTPQHVLKQQAYILFYSKIQPNAPVDTLKKDLNLKFESPAINTNGTSKSTLAESSSSSSNRNKSDISSNIDDELDFGVSLNTEELLALTIAKEKLAPTTNACSLTGNISNGLNDLIDLNGTNKKRKLSSSSLSTTEYDDKDIVTANGIDMRYGTCSTRLRVKCSWALKPLRFVGNARKLCVWSGKNKIKLRDGNTEKEKDEDQISAKESFASWGKVVDMGEAKSREFKKRSEMDVVSSSSALKHYNEEELNLMDESDSSSEVEMKEENDDIEADSYSSESDAAEEEGGKGSESATARSSYQPDKVIIGEQRPTKIDYSAMVRMFYDIYDNNGNDYDNDIDENYDRVMETLEAKGPMVWYHASPLL